MEGAIAEIIKSLLGLGLPGIIILAGGYWIFRQSQRINELTDKVIAMSAEQAKQAEAMNGSVNRLTDTIIRSGKVAAE